LLGREAIWMMWKRLSSTPTCTMLPLAAPIDKSSCGTSTLAPRLETFRHYLALSDRSNSTGPAHISLLEMNSEKSSYLT
jgi:hypothetical protein